MVKKKSTVDRLLMITVNILLTAMLGIFIFLLNLGIQVSKDVKEWKTESLISQQETTRAVNELKVVLMAHSGRIGHNENDIGDIKIDVRENKKRINILEDIIK